MSLIVSLLYCNSIAKVSSVPPLQDSEILNTAVLSGRTVAVPVKVVTVGTDGAVSDVTESVECRSTDELVIKVRSRSIAALVAASVGTTSQVRFLN